MLRPEEEYDFGHEHQDDFFGQPAPDLKTSAIGLFLVRWDV
jgi:hypothetical protein